MSCKSSTSSLNSRVQGVLKTLISGAGLMVSRKSRISTPLKDFSYSKGHSEWGRKTMEKEGWGGREFVGVVRTWSQVSVALRCGSLIPGDCISLDLASKLPAASHSAKWQLARRPLPDDCWLECNFVSGYRGLGRRNFLGAT